MSGDECANEPLQEIEYFYVIFFGHSGSCTGSAHRLSAYTQARPHRVTDAPFLLRAHLRSTFALLIMASVARLFLIALACVSVDPVVGAGFGLTGIDIGNEFMKVRGLCRRCTVRTQLSLGERL
jgi:hypothetical protein